MKKSHGQVALEYILVFVAVLFVLLVAVKPNGFVATAVNQALNTVMVDGAEEMARGVYYNVFSEPGTNVLQ
jgi:hypothetical protein